MWKVRIAVLGLLGASGLGQSPAIVAKAVQAYTPVYVTCGTVEVVGAGTFIAPTIVVTVKHLQEPDVPCTYLAGDVPATVLRVHATEDVLWLRVETPNPHFVTLARAELYSSVVAIGTPEGVPAMPAFGRVLKVAEDETHWLSDLVASPGCSGGGAFNDEGALVGMVQAVIREDAAYTLLIASPLLIP